MRSVFFTSALFFTKLAFGLTAQVITEVNENSESSALIFTSSLTIPMNEAQLCFKEESFVNDFNPLERFNYFSKLKNDDDPLLVPRLSYIVDENRFIVSKADNALCLMRKQPGPFLFKVQKRVAIENNANTVIAKDLIPKAYLNNKNLVLKFAHEVKVQAPLWQAVPNANQDWIDLVLVRQAKLEETRIGNTKISLVYRSQAFTNLWPKLTRILEGAESILGPFPYPTLSIVESSLASTKNLPAVIVLNQPKPAFMSFLQNNLLNWQEWAIVSLLFSQWFSKSVRISEQDAWLATAICDYLTYSYLRNEKQHFNFINSYNENIHLLYFDYLQFQELSADLLRRRYPESPLLTESLQVIKKDPEYARLIPTKGYFGFRYLASLYGDKEVLSLFPYFAKKYAGEDLTAFLILKELDERWPTPLYKKTASHYLRRFWTLKNWPDLAIGNVTKTQVNAKTWLSKIEVSDQGKTDLPIEVLLVGKQEGQKLFAFASTNKNGEANAILSDFEPVDVIVDPRHQVYDLDRFDNSLEGAGINFYPGSTNTLSNSDYTTVWLPYAIKRPGEAFNLGFTASLYRYIDQALFISLEFSPVTRQGAFNIQKPFAKKILGQNAEFAIAQDAQGNQLAQFELTGQSPKEAPRSLDLVGRILAHQIRGDRHSFYPSLAFGLKASRNDIHPSLKMEGSALIEHSVAEQMTKYSFQRISTTTTTKLSLGSGIDLSERLFYGLLDSFGERLPKDALFIPNRLSEAGARIDSKTLAPSMQILSIKNDLLFPMPLPLPSYLMVVKDKMRANLFIDLARSYSPPIHNYFASGVGIHMPLGGELTGVGHLVIQNFTVLAIFYHQVDRKSEWRLPPDLLFSLSGEF